MFTPENLLGSLLFSGIGLAAFTYGKKLAKLKPLFFGMGLMAYPYFITETWLLYGIGTILTAGLWFWRE